MKKLQINSLAGYNTAENKYFTNMFGGVEAVLSDSDDKSNTDDKSESYDASTSYDESTHHDTSDNHD